MATPGLLDNVTYASLVVLREIFGALAKWLVKSARLLLLG
jgi:hypothetical protein